MTWTKEQCSQEALKFNVQSHFREGSRSAYRFAKLQGWLPDICAHMRKFVRVRWTKHQCASEAAHYSTRVGFERGHRRMFRSATTNGWIDEICAHMAPKQRRWTKQKCAMEAKKYQTLADFRTQSCQAYWAAHYHGWISDVTRHLVTKASPLQDHDRVVYVIKSDAARIAYIGLTVNPRRRYENHKYLGRYEVQSLIRHEHQFIVSNAMSADAAIQEEARVVCLFRDEGYLILNIAKAGALGNTGRIWTKKKCQSAASAFMSRKSFYSAEPQAYNAAVKNGWIVEICQHMGERVRWTKEKCAEAASVFDTKGKFKAKHPSAYMACRKRGWLNDVCSHMPINARYPNGVPEAKERVTA